MQGLTQELDNAWPVNFNWDITSFEPHIAGVRNMVDFSAGSSKKAEIFFISSIGATMAWGSDAAVPEDIIEDLAIGRSSGYTLSKQVSELLLASFADRGIRSKVCRVGQIAGPVLRGIKGRWNKQEWLPAVRASWSVSLGSC